MARRGNCYVSAEALYHLLGGKKAGYTPYTVRHEGSVHWYLVKFDDWANKSRNRSIFFGTVLDPTRKQFKVTPDYYAGRGRGFLTKKPSKRAKALMEIMLWQK